MAAAMSSSSCCVSSLRLLPFKRTLFSSLHPPPKALIFRPLKAPSFRRTIITFQKAPKRIVSASSSPSNSGDDLQPIEELPPKLQELVKLFQSVHDPKAKYNQLIFYGMNLKPLDSRFKTRENKVEGCVSQVWVRAFLDDEGNVVYEADSDTVITKGLAALLVMGLSGRPVPEIMRVKPDFAVLLGLRQSLSPSRSNGFLNMLKLMQKKALHLAVKAEEDSSSGEISESTPEASVLEADSSSEPSQVEEDSSSGEVSESSLVATHEANEEASVPEADSSSGPSPDKDLETEKIQDSENESKIVALGSRGIRIRDKLEKELNPIELEVEDVSHQHSGHAAVRGGDDNGGETHFSLRIVSDCFQGKSLIKRHRLIYDLLQEELNSGLHALSIVAKTPAEV